MAFTDITGPEFWSQVVANVGGNPYYGEWDAIEERWSFIATGANVQELRLSAKAAWQAGKKITRLQLTYLMVDPNPIAGATLPLTFSDGGWFQTDVQGKTVATADALVSAPPDISTTGDSEETVLYRFNPLRTLRVFGPVYTDAADDYTIVETYITKIEAEIVDLPALTCSTFWVSRIQTYEQLATGCDPQLNPVPGWHEVTNDTFWEPDPLGSGDEVWDGAAWLDSDAAVSQPQVRLKAKGSWYHQLRPTKLRITYEQEDPGAVPETELVQGSMFMYDTNEDGIGGAFDLIADPRVSQSGTAEIDLTFGVYDLSILDVTGSYLYDPGSVYPTFRVTKIEILIV